MAKRRITITAFLLCLCLLLCPFYANAASTADATEQINTDAECALELCYAHDQTAFAGVDVSLYKIASVSCDFQFTLTEAFGYTDLLLNGIKTNQEWNQVRSTLQSHIVAGNIKADYVTKTNDSGKALFESLKTGLYMAVAADVNSGETIYRFDSALVLLPTLDANNSWQYQASVAPKYQIITPDHLNLSVVKLWKGDNANKRPKSVEVEIFKNGTSYKKVVLSNQNNWSYSWAVDQDYSDWAVIEPNVPTGYTMTVENKDNAFIVTNTYKSGSYNPTQTGDTANVMLYVILMIVSGSMLIILAVVRKRRTNDDSKK